MAGVRCFQQIPRTHEARALTQMDWYYCTTDVNMTPSELQTLGPERTAIKIGAATVTVHPIEAKRVVYLSEPQIWTLRRVDVVGATVRVLGTEFRGWPGYRIGFIVTEDGRGAMYGRTVFALHDPKTKEFMGAISIIADPGRHPERL